MPFLACAMCGTFKWNGVAMCGKVCEVSPVLVRSARGVYEPSEVHACTRKVGHWGDCKAHRLVKPNGEPRNDYVPE
jgi:hypothetical protein